MEHRPRPEHPDYPPRPGRRDQLRRHRDAYRQGNPRRSPARPCPAAGATTSCSPPRSGAPIGEDPSRRVVSRRWIVREVEDSLRRLRTDWIDLHQIHLFEPDTDVDETLGALTDLVHQGKVCYIGHSTFPASSRAAPLPEMSVSANQRKLDAVEQFTAPADEAGITLIQLAIAFVLNHPAITAPIIGPRTMEHLEGQLARATSSSTRPCSTASTRSSRPARPSTQPTTPGLTQRWSQRPASARSSPRGRSAACDGRGWQPAVVVLGCRHQEGRFPPGPRHRVTRWLR
jgi:Aldo/keto reductase family